MGRKMNWRLPVIAAAALIAGAGVSGTTLAMWSADSATAASVITSGNLEAQVLAPVWRETSADVEAAPHVIDPNTFLARQGDTLTASYDFPVTAEGDNLQVTSRVHWNQAPELPAGVTGSYEIQDLNGTAIGGSKPIGDASAAQPVNISAGNAGVRVVFTLDLGSLSDRVGSASAEQALNLGDFAVEFAQVRPAGDNS